MDLRFWFIYFAPSRTLVLITFMANQLFLRNRMLAELKQLKLQHLMLKMTHKKIDNTKYDYRHKVSAIMRVAYNCYTVYCQNLMAPWG